MNQLLHTPEGVRDIYDVEYAKKLVVEGRIRNVLSRYGYRELQTPSFEFFDIFNKERGSVASREMYKFFDREGNTLVLRPDMTPSIARCAAKYYTEEQLPIRLSYLANTFINYSSYRGRLKEATVQGAELINDASSDADAEMIAMVIDCLLAAGLRDFKVDIGQVEFFNGLVEAAGLDEETENELRDLIEEKNYFGVEALIRQQNLSAELSEIFAALPQLFGSAELLETARRMTVNERSAAAILRLENLYRILNYYGLTDYVSFDLGMLGKYRYYTGIIFKGVTFGMGEPIVSGGRYDGLLRQFGKEAPSVGFSISVDGLMSALSRQHIETETEAVDRLLLYDRARQQEAFEAASAFRKNGMRVQMTRKEEAVPLSDYEAYMNRNHLKELYYLEEGKEMPQIIKAEEKETGKA